MATIHSFKFYYHGTYYYPFAEVVTQTTFKVHFDRCLEQYSLPQTFVIDSSCPSIVIHSDVVLEIAMPFLLMFKEKLMEHLIAIRALKSPSHQKQD